MAKTETTTQLLWNLESKNFDEMKKEMIEDGDRGMVDYVDNHIGNNHCKLCVLASGPMCIHRAVCRIPQNEIWVNAGIEEVKNEKED